MSDDPTLQNELRDFSGGTYTICNRAADVIDTLQATIRQQAAEIERLKEQLAVLPTHVCVPAKPTEAMQLAMYNASGLRRGEEQMRLYIAMLRAALEESNE